MPIDEVVDRALSVGIVVERGDDLAGGLVRPDRGPGPPCAWCQPLPAPTRQPTGAVRNPFERAAALRSDWPIWTLRGLLASETGIVKVSTPRSTCSAEIVGIEVFTEEQLPAELALRPFVHDNLVALLSHGSATCGDLDDVAFDGHVNIVLGQCPGRLSRR